MSNTNTAVVTALVVVLSLAPQFALGQLPDPIPGTTPTEKPPRTILLDNLDENKAATPDEIRKDAATRFQAVTGLNLQPNADGQLVVSEIRQGSAGADVGVKQGDVVVQVNDATVTDGRSLSNYLAEHAKLSSYLITFARGENTFTAAVGRNVDLLGMLVLPDDSNRPAVRYVATSSPADAAGVMPADLIAVVNGQKVKDYGEFLFTIVPLLRAMAPGEQLPLGLLRGGEEVAVLVTRPADLKLPPVDVTNRTTTIELKAAESRQAVDVAAATLFSTRLLGEVGQVPPIPSLHATGWLTMTLDHGQTLVEAEFANMPAGDYTVAVHRYGDIRNLGQDSAGVVFKILGTLTVDTAGTARFHEVLANVQPVEMVGRTVSLLPHGRESLEPAIADPQPLVGRYEFGAFGVLGLARPFEASLLRK